MFQAALDLLLSIYVLFFAGRFPQKNLRWAFRRVHHISHRDIVFRRYIVFYQWDIQLSLFFSVLNRLFV